MTAKTPNAYLRTKVMTASPAELRLMLFDGAIKFAEQARTGIEGSDYEAVYTGVTRCQSILLELINSLQRDRDPSLCEKLSALYTFMYTQLVSASTERDASKVADVIDLLRFERETWQMLIDRMSSENAAAGSVTDTPSARPAGKPTEGAAAEPSNAKNTNLVGARISLQG